MQKLFSAMQRRFRPQAVRDRRDFLAKTAAIGAGLLISNRVCRISNAQTTDRQRVVIVGGGFAGLACAHEMLAAGYDVQIVEARNRIGGRVLSFGDMIPNRVVEGGAELIGSNHPTWVAYAEKFGLEFWDVTDDEDLNVPIHIAGRLLDDVTAERLYLRIEKAIDSLTKMSEAVDPEKPWESADAKRLDRQSVADWIAKLDESTLLKRLIGIEFASDNAVDNSKASMLAMLAAIQGGGGQRYWTDSEVYRCQGGNDRLARRLAESIGEQRIRLGDPVVRIEYQRSVATVHCASGAKHQCDRVVLAVPTSTWNAIRFEPDLPGPLKQQQMGVAVKYLAQVRRRFWLDGDLSQYAITDGPISQTWESTDGQDTVRQDTTKAAEVSGAYGLTAFSGGPQAEICLGFNKATRDADYAAEFEKVYPGFADQFLQARFMDWPREPHILSGYSFPGIGQITSIGKTLYDGLERLQFCGEQTCFRFPGFMEGGLYSGVAIAQRITEKDGLPVR
jgi:monoamine oxidase